MDLIVTHVMGGMLETQRTDVYPNYLSITSMECDHKWKVYVNEEIQKDSLKIKGKTAYNYIFDNDKLLVQEINDDTVNQDWIEVPMGTMMRD